ncbi:CapA family protein [bacterium]|nr:CapA family protein [bacterium]
MWVFLASGCSSSEKVDVYTGDDLAAMSYASAPGETSIVFVGDMYPWDFAKKHVKDDPAYMFRGTAPILQQADLTVGNLETPVAVKAEKRKRKFDWKRPIHSLKAKSWVYKLPPRMLDGLHWAGIDLVSLANNHIGDCRADGVSETLEHLQAHGIKAVGAGNNLREAARPTVVEVNGVKFAFVASVSAETWITDIGQVKEEKNAIPKRRRWMKRRLQATKDSAGSVITSESMVRRMVRRAKRMADVVVYFPHWGIRYHRPVFDEQAKMARAAIDAGADLVVGHHIHIWQPSEIYEGKPIVYGLGNFAFGSNNRRANEGLVVRAIFRGKSLDRLELYPTYTKNVDPVVKYQTKLLRGTFAGDTLRRVNLMSSKRGAEYAIREDKGVLYFSPDGASEDEGDAGSESRSNENAPARETHVNS